MAIFSKVGSKIKRVAIDAVESPDNALNIEDGYKLTVGPGILNRIADYVQLFFSGQDVQTENTPSLRVKGGWKRATLENIVYTTEELADLNETVDIDKTTTTEIAGDVQPFLTYVNDASGKLGVLTAINTSEPINPDEEPITTYTVRTLHIGGAQGDYVPHIVDDGTYKGRIDNTATSQDMDVTKKAIGTNPEEKSRIRVQATGISVTNEVDNPDGVIRARFTASNDTGAELESQHGLSTRKLIVKADNESDVRPSFTYKLASQETATTKKLAFVDDTMGDKMVTFGGGIEDRSKLKDYNSDLAAKTYVDTLREKNVNIYQNKEDQQVNLDSPLVGTTTDPLITKSYADEYYSGGSGGGITDVLVDEVSVVDSNKHAHIPAFVPEDDYETKRISELKAGDELDTIVFDQEVPARAGSLDITFMSGTQISGMTSGDNNLKVTINKTDYIIWQDGFWIEDFTTTEATWSSETRSLDFTMLHKINKIEDNGGVFTGEARTNNQAVDKGVMTQHLWNKFIGYVSQFVNFITSYLTTIQSQITDKFDDINKRRVANWAGDEPATIRFDDMTVGTAENPFITKLYADGHYAGGGGSGQPDFSVSYRIHEVMVYLTKSGFCCYKTQDNNKIIHKRYDALTIDNGFVCHIPNEDFYKTAGSMICVAPSGQGGGAVIQGVIGILTYDDIIDSVVEIGQKGNKVQATLSGDTRDIMEFYGVKALPDQRTTWEIVATSESEFVPDDGDGFTAYAIEGTEDMEYGVLTTSVGLDLGDWVNSAKIFKVADYNRGGSLDELNTRLSTIENVKTWVLGDTEGKLKDFSDELIGRTWANGTYASNVIFKPSSVPLWDVRNAAGETKAKYIYIKKSMVLNANDTMRVNFYNGEDSSIKWSVMFSVANEVILERPGMTGITIRTPGQHPEWVVDDMENIYFHYTSNEGGDYVVIELREPEGFDMFYVGLEQITGNADKLECYFAPDGYDGNVKGLMSEEVWDSLKLDNLASKHIWDLGPVFLENFNERQRMISVIIDHGVAGLPDGSADYAGFATWDKTERWIQLAVVNLTTGSWWYGRKGEADGVEGFTWKNVTQPRLIKWHLNMQARIQGTPNSINIVCVIDLPFAFQMRSGTTTVAQFIAALQEAGYQQFIDIPVSGLSVSPNRLAISISWDSDTALNVQYMDFGSEVPIVREVAFDTSHPLVGDFHRMA